MKRLLFITGSFRSGGYERRLSYFLEWLEQNQIDEDFRVFYQSKFGPRKPNIKKHRLLYWPSHLFMKWKLKKIENLLFYFFIKVISRNSKIVLFIGHQSILEIISNNKLILNDKTVKVVFNVVNNLQYSPYKDITLSNLMRCDHIICNSRYNAEYLRNNFSLNNILYVPNFYSDQKNDQKFIQHSGTELKIVSCGSLDRQKNYHDLLEAASVLIKQGYSFTLTIFGNGEEKSKLEKIAIKKRIKSFQIIVGEDFTSHASKYDLFVCCSVFEGYPNALLEAQISGLPSVSYDIEYGPNEIIKDGYSGILVSQKNSEGLALAISNLAQNLEFYKLNTKAHAQKLKQKHSVENSIEKMVDLIKSI